MGDIFLFVILFVYGFAVILMGCVALKNKKPKNKVHFYVARDKNESLWLYIGKPRFGVYSYRSTNICERIGCIRDFPNFRLDANDYAHLKFGDEPVEVFLNMED